MQSHTKLTSRRSVLKLTGASLATLAGSGLASASHEHPDVETVRSEVTSSSSALLTGRLDAFGAGASSAKVWFDWGWKGASGFPYSTTKRTVDSTGSFSDGITGLSPDETYKFRAAAEDSDDGDRDYGDTHYVSTYEGPIQ